MSNRKKKGSGSSAGDTHHATSADRAARGEPAEPGTSSTRGGQSRRGGFGDDQGTRIGSPTPGAPRHAGPSTRPVKEGLEGAILEEDEGEPESQREPTDRSSDQEEPR